MRPDDRQYTKTHEWVKIEGNVATIGITDFAVTELCNGNEGDLVYCDLPQPGRALEAGETFGEIESVKAVADLNTPIAGTVEEVNVSIEEHLEVLSADPFTKGWMVRLKVEGKDFGGNEMLDAAAYEDFLATLAH